MSQPKYVYNVHHVNSKNRSENYNTKVNGYKGPPCCKPSQLTLVKSKCEISVNT